MATLSTRNGRRIIQWPDPARPNHRKTLTLGRMADRTARAVLAHVDHLIAARAAGQAPPLESAKWVGGLEGKLRRRLEAVGLVEPSEEKPPTKLDAFLGGYIDRRTDLKRTTRLNLEQTRRSLVGHFKESRDIGTITKAVRSYTRGRTALRDEVFDKAPEGAGDTDGGVECRVGVAPFEAGVVGQQQVGTLGNLGLSDGAARVPGEGGSTGGDLAGGEVVGNALLHGGALGSGRERQSPPPARGQARSLDRVAVVALRVFAVVQAIGHALQQVFVDRRRRALAFVDGARNAVGTGRTPYLARRGVHVVAEHPALVLLHGRPVLLDRRVELCLEAHRVVPFVPPDASIIPYLITHVKCKIPGFCREASNLAYQVWLSMRERGFRACGKIFSAVSPGGAA